MDFGLKMLLGEIIRSVVKEQLDRLIGNEAANANEVCGQAANEAASLMKSPQAAEFSD